MAHIALLHPQCVRVGGAIQMALQSAQALQKQGHTVTLYTFEKSDTCFPDLQKGLDIRVWQTGKKTEFLPLRKLIVLATLAWELRHVDIIIANNPPMQIVAAITKIFIGRIKTIWWHHHIPWYLGKGIMNNDEGIMLSVKRFIEKTFIIPNIDMMVATSYFIAGKIEEYCEREATVIHPIIQMKNEEGRMKKGTEAVSLPPFHHSTIPPLDRVTLFTHGRLEAGKGLDMIVRVFKRMKNEKGIMNNEEAVPVIARSIATKQSIPWIPTVVSAPSEGQTPAIANGVKQSMELNHGSPRNSGEFLAMTGDQTDVNESSLNTQYLIPDTQVRLIIFGTGSLEGELREKGIDLRPFDREKTFTELKSGEYGHVLGVYCSEIDGFGMAPLECQMTGISTVILDRAGARETIVANVSDEPVGYLVDSEEELFRTICHYVQEKMFPKNVSNVNFYHQKDHFTTERLSRDLLGLMKRTGV